MQFAREVEENGKLPFLDCLVSRDHNSLQTTVYRKLTHTDRRVIRQRDITQSHNYQDSNATNVTGMQHDRQLIQRKLVPWQCFLKELTATKTSFDESLTDVLQLPKLTTPQLLRLQRLHRILLLFNIRVAHKPITTIRQLLTTAGQRRTRTEEQTGSGL